MKWFALIAVIASPAAADTCPAAPDHSVRSAEIVQALQASRGELEVRILTQELWGLWTDAPDAKAQALLDEGMARREGFDLLGARDVLDRLMEYCPDYAEG